MVNWAKRISRPWAIRNPFWISECGFRISDLADHPEPSRSPNPKSEIRNPKFLSCGLRKPFRKNVRKLRHIACAHHDYGITVFSGRDAVGFDHFAIRCMDRVCVSEALVL